MSDVIAIDFETFYSKKLKYSLKVQIAEQYCRSHLFDPYVMSVSDGSTCWAGVPKDFNWDAVDGKTLLSHNAYFDSTVYEEMVRRGWAPQIAIPAWHCTANLTAYLCNRRSLDFAVEYLFKVKLAKVSREDANNKHWPADFSSQAQTEMLEYARRDAFWCWQIWDRHSHKWPEFERRLSTMTINQGKRGVQIDVALLNDYLVKMHEMLTNTEQQIPWIANSDDEVWDDFSTKPTSTKNIAEQCRLTGIPCCPVKSDDEEAYLEWENTYAPSNPWIHAVSAWRSVNKLYKTLLTVKERLRPDGTMPFALKYFGAHTGRWSGDARVNMQNMRKIPILCNEHGLMEQSEKREVEAVKSKQKTGGWPGWVKYTVDFRNLIIARPGKRLITSDLSQIEPRVLAWLCNDTAMLDLMAGGMSPYEAHARATMGWTGGKLKDEDPDLYSLAKARVLALGYQAAWEKFISMALTQANLDITANDPEWIEQIDPVTGKLTKVSGYGQFSKATVADFRQNNPKIRGMWENLDSLFKQSIGSDFIMAFPNGREMRYEKVRCEIRIEPDPVTKKPRRRSVFTTDVGGRRVQSYGGKLTENLVQGIARDVFAEHLLSMSDAGLWNLFSVHDEAILEVDLSVTASDIQAIMSKCPDWMPGLPVAAEAKQVACYQK